MPAYGDGAYGSGPYGGYLLYDIYVDDDPIIDVQASDGELVTVSVSDIGPNVSGSV